MYQAQARCLASSSCLEDTGSNKLGLCVVAVSSDPWLLCCPAQLLGQSWTEGAKGGGRDEPTFSSLVLVHLVLGDHPRNKGAVRIQVGQDAGATHVFQASAGKLQGDFHLCSRNSPEQLNTYLSGTPVWVSSFGLEFFGLAAGDSIRIGHRAFEQLDTAASSCFVSSITSLCLDARGKPRQQVSGIQWAC